MNDKTAAHITKAIKNGGTKCRDEVLSPLASPCWPEGKISRTPPLFIASGVIKHIKEHNDYTISGKIIRSSAFVTILFMES